MIDAISIAESAMLNDLYQLNVVSNNVANATTPGFLRELAFAQSTDQALNELSNSGTPIFVGTDERAAIPVIDKTLSLKAGSLRNTGNPLDLAIDSNGFFEVNTASGTAYTRRGDFSLERLGYLVNFRGDRVQSLGGDIRILEQNPRINEAGVIFEGDKRIGQIKVVSFPDDTAFTRNEAGYLVPAGRRASTVDDAASVRQGHLQAANVDSATEVLKLMEIRRHFQASSNVIKAYDSMINLAINDIGDF
ncbi:MAG: flagellar hook basal-body protein [Pseudomonadota bacterium]